MQSRDEEKVFREVAEVPLPHTNGLIEREWKLKRGRKDDLAGYETKFSRDSESANFNLVFYKYPPDIRKEEIKGRKSKWLTKIADASQFSKVISIIESNLPDTHLYKILKAHSNDQLKEKLKVIFGLRDRKNVAVLDAKTTQPLIIGLGEPSPYETGITLDFLTGLPIIPGSAVKGIARRAAIMILSGDTDVLPYGEEFEKLAKEYDQDERVVEIFGTQDQKGKVIFMDAYPVDWENALDGKLFRVDIMNPHYGPYYSSKGWDKKEGKPVPPADWYDPNPIFYLTVNERVTYRFILASRDKNLLDTAYKWLKFALENIGVGAKGNQGYGVFEVDAN